MTNIIDEFEKKQQKENLPEINVGLVNSKSGETLTIGSSQAIGEIRKLILQVTVPEQSGLPRQSHRFEYELAGDR